MNLLPATMFWNETKTDEEQIFTHCVKNLREAFVEAYKPIKTSFVEALSILFSKFFWQFLITLAPYAARSSPCNSSSAIRLPKSQFLSTNATLTAAYALVRALSIIILTSLSKLSVLTYRISCSLITIFIIAKIVIFIQRWAFNVFTRPNVLGLSTERPVFVDKRTGQEAGQGKRDSTDCIYEKTSTELLLLRFFSGVTGTTFEERFAEHYRLTLW